MVGSWFSVILWCLLALLQVQIYELTFYPHKSSVLPNLKISELQQKENAIIKVKLHSEMEWQWTLLKQIYA